MTARSSILLIFIAAGCGPAITPGAGSENTGSSTSESGSSTGGPSTGGSSTSGTSSSPPGGSTVTSAGSTSTATTQTGETGETSGGALGCFADAFSEPAHGELVYDDGGLLAGFEGCDEQSYVFEHRGDEVVDPEVVIRKFGFVLGLSVEPCCDESGPSCVRVAMQAFDFSLEQAAAMVAELFPEPAENCFGIRVDLIGLDAPRCDRDDARCLPEPYCDPTFNDDCPVYDPSAERIPVGEDYSTNAACVQDGECMYNGLRCKGWMEPYEESSPAVKLPLHDAFCGCVENACQWFEQP